MTRAVSNLDSEEEAVRQWVRGEGAEGGVGIQGPGTHAFSCSQENKRMGGALCGTLQMVTDPLVS